MVLRGVEGAFPNGRLLNRVAVGMRRAPHPPHRSLRARLEHTASTSDVWRRTSLAERGEDYGDGVASGRNAGLGGPSSDNVSGCGGEEHVAARHLPPSCCHPEIEGIIK